MLVLGGAGALPPVARRRLSVRAHSPQPQKKEKWKMGGEWASRNEANHRIEKDRYHYSTLPCQHKKFPLFTTWVKKGGSNNVPNIAGFHFIPVIWTFCWDSYAVPGEIVGGKESRRIGRISNFAAESSQKAVPVLFVFVLFFSLSRSVTALLFFFFRFLSNCHHASDKAIFSMCFPRGSRVRPR